MLCCNACLNGQHPGLLKAYRYLSLTGRDRRGAVLIDVIGLMAITEEMQRDLRASGLELKQLRKLRKVVDFFVINCCNQTRVVSECFLHVAD